MGLANYKKSRFYRGFKIKELVWLFKEVFWGRYFGVHQPSIMGGHTGCSVSWYKGAASEQVWPITRNRGFTGASKSKNWFGFSRWFFGAGILGFISRQKWGVIQDVQFLGTKVRSNSGVGQLQEIEVLPLALGQGWQHFIGMVDLFWE